MARTVMVIDEDSKEIEMLQRALGDCGFNDVVFAVRDSSEAIAYCRGEGEFADRSRFPIPKLVLINHKTAGTGWELLTWARQRSVYLGLPIIVLSSTDGPGEERKAIDLGANAYHVKPQTYDELRSLMQRIAGFWILSSGLSPQ